MNEAIKLVIDYDTLAQYEKYYFSIHTRAKKKPIAKPYHESINTWMVMRRPEMNALKQKWKDFMVWYIGDMGYTDLHIECCTMRFVIYYENNRRRDCDNFVPKFQLDGMVESGMLADDDCLCVTSLTLECKRDKDNPRTEIYINITE